MIKFGMKLPEIFTQLVKGYRKVTGRDPEGLDLIRIRQESLRRFQDMNKVVDMEGRTLDPSKAITGGTQEFASGIMKAMKTKPREVKEVQKRIDSGVASAVEKILRIDPIDAMKEANKVIKREGDYKNLTKNDAKKILDAVEDKLKNIDMDPEDMFADGGRIGLKKGMDRRTFMKIMGGLTTIPVFGKFFKGAEVAAPVVEKAAETATQAPTYFFNLMTKIKMFGKKSKVGPSDRVDEYSYTGKNGDEYTLTEDITTGDAQITKDKIGGRSYEEGSYDVIEDRTVMDYKARKQDFDVETQRPIDESAEYEEYKVDFDQDGTEAGADAIDERIQKEIIEEAAEEAPSIKKASGGIARMLGE